jgi:hypothetical protein
MASLKRKVSTRMVAMPAARLEKLNGYSLGDAMDEGLITSVGSEKGFIFPHADENIERYYAVIDGQLVTCSKGLIDNIDTIEAGDMVIAKHTSLKKYKNGKESEDEDAEFVTVYRLQMPAGINIDDSSALVTDVYAEEPETA